MSSLFLTMLNMSLTAGFVALAVIIVRLMLKRIPKIFSYVLWAAVLFRLLCPFTFESSLSLLPVDTEPISHDIIYSQNPAITTGTEIADNAVNQSIQSFLPPVSPTASVNPIGTVLEIGAIIWGLGIIVLLSYGAISYCGLKHRLSTAILVHDNIYETDRIRTPFVLGVIRPRIYIPTDLSGSEQGYIIKHEQTHIRRYDYIVKPIAFIALAMHWFNPLIWVSYFLMVKDMELSCDESVMKHSNEDIRVNYSNSLLAFSVKQSGLISPLAFGESNAKSRIKNILNYKKPSFWVIIVAFVAVLTVAVGLVTNPLKADTIEDGNNSRQISGTAQDTTNRDTTNRNIDNDESNPDITLENAAGPQEIDRLLSVIMSSPMYSSATGDYIKAHKKEYDEIVSMGEDALPYLIGILNSGDRGLRGNIVKLLCDDIIKSIIEGSVDDPETEKLIKESITSADNWNSMMGYDVVLKKDTEPMPGFTAEEITAAQAVVEEYFRAIAAKDGEAVLKTLAPRYKKNHPNAAVSETKETRTLLSVDYKEDDPMRRSYVNHGGGSVNGTKIENVIVFRVEHNVKYPEGVSGPFEGDYTGWSMILIHDDSTSPWLIEDQGY